MKLPNTKTRHRRVREKYGNALHEHRSAPWKWMVIAVIVALAAVVYVQSQKISTLQKDKADRPMTLQDAYERSEDAQGR